MATSRVINCAIFRGSGSSLAISFCTSASKLGRGGIRIDCTSASSASSVNNSAGWDMIDTIFHRKGSQIGHMPWLLRPARLAMPYFSLETLVGGNVTVYAVFYPDCSIKFGASPKNAGWLWLVVVGSTSYASWV